MPRLIVRSTPAVLVGLLLTACGGSDAAPVNSELGEAMEFDANLAAALTDSQSVDAFRVTSFQAQTIQLEDLGLDDEQSIDPSRPTTVAELDGEGSSHLVLDLSSTFDSLAAANPEQGDAFDDVQIELWSSPDQIVVDTTAYEPIEEVSPGQLGVFSPGVFAVDLDRVGEVGGDDFAQALVGSEVPSMDEISAGLSEQLESPVPDPSDPNVYTGTLSFGELLSIQGSSSDESAAGAAAGIAASLGIDGQRLADLYASTYDETDLDVVVTIGDDGLLESIEYEADLSSFFTGLGEIVLEGDTGLGPVPDEERDEVESAFSTGVLEVDGRLEFEADDSIVVEAPSGDLEDRTDEMVAFFEQSGIDLFN